MAYNPPAFNNIVIGAPEQPYTPPMFNAIIIGLTNGVGRRALFLDGASYKSIPDNLIGTGIKPLIIEDSGAIHPRINDEGIPLVWLENSLKTLPDDDYLIL